MDWAFVGCALALDLLQDLIGGKVTHTQPSCSSKGKLVQFLTLVDSLYSYHIRNKVPCHNTTHYNTPPLSLEVVSWWKIWQWKFFVFDPSAPCATLNRAISGFTAG